MTKKDPEEAKTTKREQALQKQVHELTEDVQRLRADFENYRKRTETEKEGLRELTKAATVMKLLPLVDNIELALHHVPAELAEHDWAKGVASLMKNLEKALIDLGLTRIEAKPGTTFDPNQHEAIVLEDGEGENEVVSQELRAGYKLGHQVIRPSMVKVAKK